MLIFVGLPAQQTWLECVSYPTIRFVTKGCWNLYIYHCTLSWCFRAKGYWNLLHPDAA
jgi:hypothetical protein